MVDFSGQCTRHSRARNEADWWGRTFLVAGSMKTNSRIRVERFLNSTFNAFICHVVWFWKSRENCRKLLRNIFGIKYKILLSIKLNIIIRFNSSNFLHFERIIRKSNELDSQNFPQKEKKKRNIYSKISTGPKSEGSILLDVHKVSFFAQPVVYPACSRSTASYRIGNEALAHHESSPLVLLLFHQIPEGSQGRRRDGQRGKGVRKRGRGDGETGWESGGSGQGLLSFEQPEFLRLFFTVTPAVPEPLIANVTHNVVSLRTSCVEHEDRPCIRIRWQGGWWCCRVTKPHRPKREKTERKRRGRPKLEKGELKRAIDWSV